MSGPGSGRYTTFVPIKSARNSVLKSVYNDRYGSKADIYEGSKSFDNFSTAQVAAENSLKIKNKDEILEYWSEGISLFYKGAPDVSSVKFVNPGDPANPYVPDLSSPGVNQGVPSIYSDPGISINDVKPNFDPKNLPLGEENPAVTSKKLAKSILTAGKNVEFGKSLATTEK
jgi:hypothetical protein